MHCQSKVFGWLGSNEVSPQYAISGGSRCSTRALQPEVSALTMHYSIPCFPSFPWFNFSNAVKAALNSPLSAAALAAVSRVT